MLFIPIVFMFFVRLVILCQAADRCTQIAVVSSRMEKLNKKSVKNSATHSKQAKEIQLQNLSDHNEIRNTLANKLSEMSTLHDTIIHEQNHLIEENKKLNQELKKLTEESIQAIAIKDKEIEQLKKEIGKHCERLERDIDEVEVIVKKSRELEIKNREMQERDNQLNKELCELQERLVTKDKIIRMKTKLVQMKQKDVFLLKEKTEQLLQIYENSMKEKLKNISDMCTEICNHSSTSFQNKEDEEESSV